MFQRNKSARMEKARHSSGWKGAKEKKEGRLEDYYSRGPMRHPGYLWHSVIARFADGIGVSREIVPPYCRPLYTLARWTAGKCCVTMVISEPWISTSTVSIATDGVSVLDCRKSIARLAASSAPEFSSTTCKVKGRVAQVMGKCAIPAVELMMSEYGYRGPSDVTFVALSGMVLSFHIVCGDEWEVGRLTRSSCELVAEYTSDHASVTMGGTGQDGDGRSQDQLMDFRVVSVARGESSTAPLTVQRGGSIRYNGKPDNITTLLAMFLRAVRRAVEESPGVFFSSLQCDTVSSTVDGSATR